MYLIQENKIHRSRENHETITKMKKRKTPCYQLKILESIVGRVCTRKGIAGTALWLSIRYLVV